MMNFSLLTPADYAKYQPYFKNQRHELCSYALSSIIAWSNDEYQPYGAEYENAFVVAAEFNEMKKDRHLMLPISPDRLFSPEELAELATLAGHKQFWFVPQAYIDHYGQGHVERYFSIKQHAAYDDYIYRAADLAELKGNRFAKKRNLIKQFRREYDGTGRVTIDPITTDNTEACQTFLEEWCQERDCDSDDQFDLACEKQAAINTLENYATFDLKGILLRIDGKVSAFGISAPLTGDMATLQYEKAFGSIKGLYQYFDNACAKMLFNGYTYINKESDMGIPGLTKAKKSYHPERMVQSSRLVLNH